MADSDLDGGLADAETDESLAFLQEVIARIGGGRFTEGISDDRGIDPSDRGDEKVYGASSGLLALDRRP
jgi:hypothetical protein